ncbi:hypothetical protein LSH36_1106g00038 [Paralvinella palmiformis]|uniref:C-type lectin domain-containing protein n=1 Tax=Paralvinella palmiformis TaxID=53620 RepID=A0AAD9IUU9_9ANNE|nr:hypothetical protein LSH36_1106g00038 [Paralvinella palmiformis]
MEVYTFTYVFVYCYAIVLMLAIQPTTQSDDTKRFCQNMRDPINVTLLQTDKITHPTNVNIKYYLYRINESTLTWCDSYNVCKQRGQRLAILNTKELQQEMTKLNFSDVVKIWIAGRRKDYGSDWTWVNDTLTDVSEDFTIYDNDTITKGEVNNTITSSYSLNWWSPGVHEISIHLEERVGIVIGVIRKKQAENTIRNYNQGGVTNSVVTGYSEAHERGPVMNPPDLMAYRVESSEADMIPYNDANHTYEHVIYCYAIVLMLAIQPTTQSDDTNRFCQNMRDPINVTLLETDKITHPTNVNIKYYLYRINDSTLTWCDSYNVCKQRGQRLAILNTKELQQEMTKLNFSDVVKIWIAGRRKDYGSDWTWVNDTLNDVSEDITIYDNDTITKVYLITNKIVSWYNAMNQCVDAGGRLATWQELPVKGDGNVYWFGLYKKPWLWIDPDQEYLPVLYSSWSSPSGGDCMTLLANGYWMATDCMMRLQYVMCEGYSEAHERGPVMTPPDLMAYRAESSETDVIPHNDANHTYEHLSSPAPPSEYTLINNPRSGPG